MLAGGAALVAALLAGYLLAARTASPLRRFAATAAEADAGDLNPLLESGSADAKELRTLAESFNHMLDRLDSAFARQRQFTSDASHELRSPLTAIRGQLEVLAREDNPSAEDVRRVEAATTREVPKMERLVDDLLALALLDSEVGLESARGGDRPIPQTPAQRLRPSRGLRSACLCTGSIDVDPDLLAQAVRNLLSNAHR